MLSCLLAVTRGIAVLAALAIVAGCRAAAPESSQADQAPVLDSSGFPQQHKTVIAFLGDSLTEGQGLTSLQAFPAQIEDLFRGEGYRDIEVLNAGVSGDTTAGGRQRVEQLFAP